MSRTIRVDLLRMDRAQIVAMRLETLLQHACGPSGEAFRCELVDEAQDAYLSLAAELAAVLVGLLKSATRQAARR